MNLPPLPQLPKLTGPMAAADEMACAMARESYMPGGFAATKSSLEQAIRTYAEQYGRLCAEAAVRDERKRVAKAEREEAESSAVEAMWKERQGEDYGSY